MDTKDKIKAVEFWQHTVGLHPLTCGMNSTHSNLVAEEIDSQLVLRCTDCKYVQHHIPKIIFSHFEANYKEPEEKKEEKRD